MYALIKSLIFISFIFINPVASSFAKDSKGLFGSNEYKSTKLSAFKKWNDLRQRHEKDNMHPLKDDTPINSISCKINKDFKCLQNEWQDLLENLKNEPSNVKLATINNHLNKAAYITDIANWQQSDYWATIQQFFNKEGDCEDYAIAKYYSLKYLGFSADQMRIVIVQDTNLNIAHAILAVYLDDKIWILDNQISQIITDDKIAHYVPLYSINETAWWLHKT